MSIENFNDVWGSDAPQFEDPRAEYPLLIPTGWQGGAGQEPPKARWENWWHNRVDSALQKMERTGASQWFEDVPYSPWATVTSPQGEYYICISQNQGVNPDTDDGTNWANFERIVKRFLNSDNPAPVFGVRAWANFNGSVSPVAVRASGNVSSVTRISKGVFQVNFAQSMLDANYSVSPSGSTSNSGGALNIMDGFNPYDLTPSGFKLQCWASAAQNDLVDAEIITFQVVR